MEVLRSDIVISGGSYAGLTLALALVCAVAGTASKSASAIEPTYLFFISVTRCVFRARRRGGRIGRGQP